jgi:hypothetical protein
VNDFRTFKQVTRVPARAMEPVVDPAGWQPSALGNVDEFSYHLSSQDRDALIDATNRVREQGIAVEEVGRENFVIAGSFADVLNDVKRELRDGRGIVMLRNFPVEQMDRKGQVMAYLGLGTYLGRPMSQNMRGHIVGHVTDLGGDYADPSTRGYLTRAEMRIHADPCDYVGLLCLQTAKEGGASCVASSVTVYNTLLARRPDLLKVLTEDFYRSRKGDVNPGEQAWYTQPIFSFSDGYFSATGAGSAIDKAQGLPGVPPMTPIQKEAIAVYRQVAEECLVDLPFKPGDVQFLNNYVLLHTRRDYTDWPERERKRHLLRLWLSDPDNRPIPQAQREGYRGRGLLPAGVRFNAPLDVFEAP